MQSSKSPRDSEVFMTQLVLPGDTNAIGGVFGGTVMSWIDIAAAIAAQRHSSRVCVTASIDELHFLKPIKKGYIVNIHARVTCVHRTSCEVRVLVQAENPMLQEKFHTARAYLTFVSLDDEGRAVEMPALKAENDEDERRMSDAKIRKHSRKKLKDQLVESNLKRKERIKNK